MTVTLDFEPKIELTNFWERFVEEDRGYETPCWIWPDGRDRNGYGYATYDGRTVNVHRLAYLAAHGSIPDGLEIDHLCEVKACGRPLHLEAVTQLENARRAVGATETHFSCGHQREHNTLTYPRRDRPGQTHTFCGYCKRKSEAKYKRQPYNVTFDEYLAGRIARANGDTVASTHFGCGHQKEHNVERYTGRSGARLEKCSYCCRRREAKRRGQPWNPPFEEYLAGRIKRGW